MTTKGTSLRLSPDLAARVAAEVDEGRARDKTEVVERALSQYFGTRYIKAPTKRLKSKGGDQ